MKIAREIHRKLTQETRPTIPPFFFSSRRRHTRFSRDWSSDVCSSDLGNLLAASLRFTCSLVDLFTCPRLHCLPVHLFTQSQAAKGLIPASSLRQPRRPGVRALQAQTSYKSRDRKSVV